MIERIAGWWFREFSQRPMLAALYMTGASVGCGVLCLNISQSNSVQSHVLARQKASMDDAMRIPRLEKQITAAKQESRQHTEELRKMVEDTKTKTRRQKLDDAFDALYSFHTGRPKESPRPQDPSTPGEH